MNKMIEELLKVFNESDYRYIDADSTIAESIESIVEAYANQRVIEELERILEEYDSGVSVYVAKQRIKELKQNQDETP